MRARRELPAYLSAPTTATAGTVTIVFENSEATGNTTGMSHTLTFDTTSSGYNHDVDLNIVASPFDDSGGRHEAQVTLTPGTYRYYCTIPGHGQMTGELVVTGDGGGGGGGTTGPPGLGGGPRGPKTQGEHNRKGKRAGRGKEENPGGAGNFKKKKRIKRV